MTERAPHRFIPTAPQRLPWITDGHSEAQAAKKGYWEEELGYYNSRPAALPEVSGDHRPETMLQALMETAPGEDPEESKEDVADLLDAVAMAVDSLPEQQRFIIEAIHYERLSFADLAKRLGLGKTQAWRLTQEAQEALKVAMLESPIIQERIN